MNYLDVKEVRKKLKLTQTEFGIKLGVSLRAVQSWESGKRNVSQSAILLLEEIKKHAQSEDSILKKDKSKAYDNNINNFKKIDNKPISYYLPNVYVTTDLDCELNNEGLERIPINIPGWENGLIFINVYGDSMYPKYNAGEIIGIKPVEFKYINYGYSYVVVLKNGDAFIKIIQQGRDKKHFVLESVNTFYKPIEFHLSLIKSVYSIKGVLKKEIM